MRGTQSGEDQMRSNSVSICAITIASFFICNFAYANWQYTEWGMSKSDVISAAKGKTKEKTYIIPENGVNKKVTQLVAPYQADDISFEASFNFSKSNRLESVSLSPVDNSDCIIFTEKLKRAYGTPIFYKDPVIRVSTMEWVDKESSNYLKLLLLGATGSCILTYYEHKTPGKPGGL